MSNTNNHGTTGKRIRTVILCCVFVLVTLVLLAAVGLGLVYNQIFNGPSPGARDALTLSMLESDSTAWIPGLFLDDQTIKYIQGGKPQPQPEAVPGEKQLSVKFETDIADEWADCPDGIRIETHHRRTFTAHVMLIRDPSTVYLATSSNTFDISINGTRMPAQMKKEGALAGINAGAFNDDGTANSYIGSLPIGMVVSEGKILWDDGKSYDGFVGLTEDHKLVVADTVDRSMIETMKIRDGCCFGPVFVKDGERNEKVYNTDTTFNARTAVGQRADGTIIFLCIDGRQAGSIGATFVDAMEMMIDLGAVNACNLDGGASTVMSYRDTYGRYGKAGEVIMCTSYALIQASPRRMPTFFMVRASEEEE